jgi:hypothetical protein
VFAGGGKFCNASGPLAVPTEGIGWLDTAPPSEADIEAEVPARKVVHLILDNYAAHKHPKVRAWLDRHERFTFHFTPTSCSWLNAVEGFFARLTSAG